MGMDTLLKRTSLLFIRIMPSFSAHFHLLLVRVTYPIIKCHQFINDNSLPPWLHILSTSMMHPPKRWTLPCQTEPKPNAECSAHLLVPCHQNHHHHFRSMARPHHPLRHHFEQLQEY